MLLTGKEVLTKTDKGYAEMREQSDGILPREARTLLILINGRDTVSDYREALNGGKAFESLGGVDQLIALLLDLDYLDIIHPNAPEDPAPAPASYGDAFESLSSDEESETDEVRVAVGEDIVLASAPLFPPSEAPAARPAAANDPSPVPRQSPPRLFEAPRPEREPSPPPPPAAAAAAGAAGERLDQLRALLADLFERHPRVEDRWSWMFRLEECRSAFDLLDLVEAFKVGVSKRIPREIAKLAASVRSDVGA